MYFGDLQTIRQIGIEKSGLYHQNTEKPLVLLYFVDYTAVRIASADNIKENGKKTNDNYIS